MTFHGAFAIMPKSLIADYAPKRDEMDRNGQRMSIADLAWIARHKIDLSEDGIQEYPQVEIQEARAFLMVLASKT